MGLDGAVAPLLVLDLIWMRETAEGLEHVSCDGDDGVDIEPLSEL